MCFGYLPNPKSLEFKQDYQEFRKYHRGAQTSIVGPACVLRNQSLDKPLSHSRPETPDCNPYYIYVFKNPYDTVGRSISRSPTCLWFILNCPPHWYLRVIAIMRERESGVRGGRQGRIYLCKESRLRAVYNSCPIPEPFLEPQRPTQTCL